MNRRYQLVADCPITLRNGAEERDREFLAGIFTEVWATIPDEDKAAIRAQAYGRPDGITIDVMPADHMEGFDGLSKPGGDIWLSRNPVDYFPRASVLRIAAHELAHKVDDAAHAVTIARLSEARRNAERRVATILNRWGYPTKVQPGEPTQADNERIGANLRAKAQKDKP